MAASPPAVGVCPLMSEARPWSLWSAASPLSIATDRYPWYGTFGCPATVSCYYRRQRSGSLVVRSDANLDITAFRCVPGRCKGILFSVVGRSVPAGASDVNWDTKALTIFFRHTFYDSVPIGRRN